MARKKQSIGIEMSLYQVRKSYEHFYEKEYPATLAYSKAAKQLFKDFEFKFIQYAQYLLQRN